MMRSVVLFRVRRGPGTEHSEAIATLTVILIAGLAIVGLLPLTTARVDETDYPPATTTLNETPTPTPVNDLSVALGPIGSQPNLARAWIPVTVSNLGQVDGPAGLVVEVPADADGF